MVSAPDERSRRRASRRVPSDNIRLVTRMLVAQAVTTAAVGLPFSRRQLSTILFTLTVTAVVSGLAVLARTGARSAWLAVLGFEVAFFLYGLSRFVVARYVGGTLFAMLIAVALMRPEVARAFGIRWGRTGAGAPSSIGDTGADTLRGETFGEETFGGHPVG